MRANRIFILFVLLLLLASGAEIFARPRRATPITTGATQTQAVNETSADTSRINARIRARSISYVDDRGLTIYVDSITGDEWTDSTLLSTIPKMEHPLLYAVSAGIDVWDPLMRVFGQQYGLGGVWAELNLHNRYIPVVEAGLGQARHTGPTDNYVYKSPLSFYMRIGANYNFLFNSNPDYLLMAGLRYGFSPFSFKVDDVAFNSPYWGVNGEHFNVPSQHVTAGWLEVSLGLRVKLWGPISAGWDVRYRALLHESKGQYGKPWYIPGYGSRSAPISGRLSISYTFSLNKYRHKSVDSEEGAGTNQQSDTSETANTVD